MDERFIAIVRRHLPLLVLGDELVPDATLWELGLDSMGAVGLVLALETELGVTLPDGSLTAATFADAANLWRAVSKSMRS